MAKRVLTDTSFEGNLSVDHPGTPDVAVRTTASSSQDAKLTIGGARTGSSVSEIGALNFRNHTSSAYDMARVVAKDPAGDHTQGRGSLTFQTADAGVLTDRFVIGYDGAAEFYQSVTIQGGTAWHANNDGSGSGLDADLLDGQHASAFAQLTGATFTGGIIAPTFDGDGSLVTGVNADSLDGFDSTDFARVGTAVSLQSLALTDADNAFSWENGVNWINGNDGGGNCQIRFGHNHMNNAALEGQDERFTHAGTAFYIGGNLDSGGGTLQMKVASNGGAGTEEAVVWGDTLEVSPTDVSFGGNQILHEGNLGSITPSSDFSVVQSTGGGVANVIWYDVSADTLYLGSLFNSGAGTVNLRAPLDVTSHDTRLGALGVGGATPDATNTFAFYGTDLLLNSGGSINMKYNKNAAGNDASMTFQTGFTTKALMGLLGNDDFTIKVGSSFTTAMVIDEATGRVDFPQGGAGPRVAQTRNTDTTTSINTASYTAIPMTGVTDMIDSSWFTVSGNGIQCLKAGRVKVTASVHMTGAIARSNVNIRIAVNGVAVGGLGGSSYIRAASGHNEASSHLSLYVNVAANDVITIEGAQEAAAGTVTMTDGGSVLLLEQW